EQRGDEAADLAAAEFGKGDRARAAGFLVDAALALADFLNGLQEVAVPVNGVPRQVQVCVEDEHVSPPGDSSSRDHIPRPSRSPSPLPRSPAPPPRLSPAAPAARPARADWFSSSSRT